MTNFDVFVQGFFYKTISAKSAGDVLGIIGKEISDGTVPGFDPLKQHDIKIVPSLVRGRFEEMDANEDGFITRDEF